MNDALDKETIRPMKRHLRKKVKHRRNRLIARIESKIRFKVFTDFEKMLFKARTGQ